MAKYLKIEVVDPCQEKWETMHAGHGGHFCSSCRKTVIDFSSMSDSQLMEYFRKPVANVCGRFYADQLETKLALPVKRIPWLKYFFQVTMPAMLLNYKANAQHFLKKEVRAFEFFSSRSSNTPGPFTLYGRITGFEAKPVPGATIMIQGTCKGVATDSNGVFILSLTGGERYLEVTAVGYLKKRVTVNGSQINVQLEIAINNDVVLPASVTGRRVRMTMGGTRSQVISTRSWYTNKKEVLRQTTSSIKVFPNPVKRNGVLTIQWKDPVSHEQQIILYNAAGVQLLQKPIPASQPLDQEQLQLDLHVAGYYIIEVLDVKTRKKQAVKFIVQ